MAIQRQEIEHGARTRMRVRVHGTEGGRTYDLYVEPIPGDGAGLVGVLTKVDQEGT